MKNDQSESRKRNHLDESMDSKDGSLERLSKTFKRSKKLPTTNAEKEEEATVTTTATTEGKNPRQEVKDGHLSPTQEPDVEESKGTEEDEKQKRMEINRLRAKDIRKRKKKMLEDMQKQIIYLTLENNKLFTQSQMQQTELTLLRKTKLSPPAPVMGTQGNIQVSKRCFDVYRSASTITCERSLSWYYNIHFLSPFSNSWIF